ncbi:DUF4282 domain-containing protein [Siculibacillus lacustris]|uniref:DUF4282 domain-containing protein n=1 Tax=Siculibacillus lacustris TaxID=1549641 RepID=A0A4Q9VHV6_9HYPH|nr:DUF4282 domain-containing protein [Siculibacillus lacustris]TBW34752.1 DUF4282 domain-containing protein [Siculibacillus lacustris]
MLSKLTNLDDFLVDRLVRPFHLLGSAFAVLVALIGWLFGVAALLQSPLVGGLVLVTVTLLAALIFLGVRIAAETVIAVFRMHQRFIGGGPWDRVPR